MDNVLVIADDDYFEDDTVNRFIDFVKITFGEGTLEENLDYIAETLKQKANETSRQAIRRYFLKDFYKDHLRTDKKRPIYWLFDSGEEDGFKALIYMHRYDESTVANSRIGIDLDDGVKVNYAKFQGIKIPQGDGKKALTANQLAKI